MTDTFYDEEFEDIEQSKIAFSHPLLSDDPDEAAWSGRELKDEDLMLLPARVMAYALRDRKFVALNIDNLQEVETYTKGWDDLRLVPGHKEMLKGLVATHLNDRESRLANGDKHNYDLVRGKGEGLIVLLHGVPGVGKTSTAGQFMSHADLRGDLGLTAESVENALQEKFHFAQVWDCILLLDEADVFLAERSAQDIKRNSLVSVFLRVLEYYTGILFLTTNRVASFDEAFKSRIHLALYFPPLKRKQTLAIWEVNLKRTLERKGGFMQADKSRIMEFAGKHFEEGRLKDSKWNGRQIRNAFQTAAALAEYEANNKHDTKGPVYSTLHTKHFKIVAKAAEQFDRYIQSIDNSTTADRVLRHGARNDDFRAEALDLNTHSPTSAKTREARGVGDYNDGEGARSATTRRSMPSRQSHKPRNLQADTYEPEEEPLAESELTQRRGPRQSHPSQTVRSPRPKKNYDSGYPTPASSAWAPPSKRSQDEDYHSPRPTRGEAFQRTQVVQPTAPSRQPVRSRQPEPDSESEEPDYSPVDSDEEE
ncbi:MAG: hypothetical protein Q9188_004998 [Gyalolechia gomerana]